MAEFVRRTFMTEAGEPLLVAPSPLETAVRFQAWASATNMGFDRMIATPMCAVPLPAYTQQESGTNRWVGVTPGMLWHPVFWLPNEVSGRYQFGDGDDSEIESDDIWAVRIGLELTASGWYDQSSGTWLDVLAMHGIDVSDELDCDRVSDWLQGGADDILDAIDMTPHLANPDDPDWALEAALDQIDGLEVIAWAMAADDLFDALDDLVDIDSESREFEDMQKIAVMIAAMAEDSFQNFPEDPGPESDDLVYSDAESIWWQGAAEAASKSENLGELTGEIIPLMQQRLGEIRDNFLPLAEAMAADESKATDDEVPSAS